MMANSHDTVHPNAELRELFNSTEKKFLYLETAEGIDDPRRQEKIKTAIENFLLTGRLIRITGVFSPNEELDDINSEDLRYLLTPAIIADLTTEIVDQESRMNNLEAANEYSKAFLQRCRELKLLSPDDEALLDDKIPKDPIEFRKMKLTRFKREKESKSKLKAFTERVARNYQAKNVSQQEGFDRDHILALLDVWVNRACCNIENVKRELEMLKQTEELRKQHGGKLPAPPKSKTNFKPFTLTRDMVKVFGQHHTPYTYTPEQYAAMEHDAGLHTCAKSSDAPVPDEEKYIEEMDNASAYKANEDGITKARNWDTFRDEHKFGEGNRYNRS